MSHNPLPVLPLGSGTLDHACLKDLMTGENNMHNHPLSILWLLIRGVQWGSAENPPVIENLAKTPLSGKADPPNRQAKLGEKFLGFLGNFLKNFVF